MQLEVLVATIRPVSAVPECLLMQVLLLQQLYCDS